MSLTEITKEEAIEALRGAAWATQVETCGHRGCYEHLGDRKKRIHLVRGGIVANWDLTDAENAVRMARVVGWVRSWGGHDLAVFDPVETNKGSGVTLFEARWPDRDKEPA